MARLGVAARTASLIFERRPLHARQWEFGRPETGRGEAALDDEGRSTPARI